MWIINYIKNLSRECIVFINFSVMVSIGFFLAYNCWWLEHLSMDDYNKCDTVFFWYWIMVAILSWNKWI